MDIAVKVVPKSAKTALAGKMADGCWKVRVAAVAERGKANRELIAFLAGHFGVAPSRVRILTGETSTHKRIRIEGI